MTESGAERDKQHKERINKLLCIITIPKMKNPELF